MDTDADLSITGVSMDRNMPCRISAIVSTYNAERFMRGCLEDLESQTIADQIEIIVVNSGSEQNEEAIVKEFQKKYSNIKYIKTNQRETLYQAWNRGIKAASGKYITNANTDDRHRKDALKILAKTLDDHPEVGFAYADCLITEVENETFELNTAQSCYIFPEFSIRQILARQFFGPQPMWRKSVHQKIGYYNPDYVVAGDYDFFIRLGWKYGGIHIPQFLGLYCKRNDSVERSNSQINMKEGYAVKTFYRNVIPVEDIYPALKHYRDDSIAFAAAYADIGNFFLQLFNDLAAAANAYKKGLVYKPDSLELLSNLSVVYKLQGKLEKANEIRKHLKVDRDLLPHGSSLMKDFEPNGNKPGNVVLMKIQHPIVNELTPVIPGSLEHSIQEGKYLQYNLKNQRQGKALENFNSALEKLSNSHFDLATDLMDNYRCLIDYELFEKLDRRNLKTPDVSVIIVAYNSNENLLHCLMSLEKQSYNNFEVIIVDNGKNEAVRSELEVHPLVLVKTPINLFPSEGRNIGASFARGKIIAFLDDDATVLENYVEEIIQAFEQYEIYGLRGKVLPKTESKNNKIARHYDLGDLPIPAIINTEGNSAFLRKIYLEMVGMNPLLFGGEGMELSYRMKKAYGDHKTIYFPDVKIFHDFAHRNDKLNEKLKRHDFMEKFIFWKHPGIHRWTSEAFEYAVDKNIRERGQKLIRKKFPPSPTYDVIMAWYQNDWGLYGRRNEMIAKALAKHGQIRQILHLEPPINAGWLRKKEQSHSIDDNFDVNLQRMRLSCDDGVWIFTPHIADGISEPENRNIVIQQIRDTIAEKQFENLILWLYPPHAMSELILYEFSSKAQFIVSDCVDDHRKYATDENRYKDTQRRYEKILKASDIVFCVSEALQKDFREINPQTFFVPNAASELSTAGIQGVDSGCHPPADMNGINGPVIGYVGALSFRINCRLLEYIARQKPEWNIVLIGTSPNSLIRQLSRRENVHVLGPKKYHQIHAYILHFDVCILPHVVNDVTDRMNPLKLYEYLQHGKPVVATSVAGVEQFREVIEVADDHDLFLKAIENSLENNSRQKTVERVNAVKAHTWPRRVDDMLRLLLQNNTRTTRAPAPSRDASTGPSYFKHSRPDIQRLVPLSSSRILDVGCGSGVLGAALKKRQPCHVTGIEYIAEIADEARKHLDEVCTGDVVEKIDELPSSTYDCIILADILEHLAEPRMVLEKLKRCLARNGRIIASIPNVRHWSVIQDLLEGRWNYTDAGILDRTHLRFFTKSSMMEMFHSAGMQVETVDETILKNCAVPQSFMDGLKKIDIDIHNLAEEGKVYQYLMVAKAEAALPQHSRDDKLVSIIILAHNQLDYTQKCLSSIIEHTALPIELIVVDNGSTDGTAEFLEQQVQQQRHGVHLEIIKNRENVGFAAGNNQGISVAQGDFVLLLNNDVVVTPNWLNHMLACFEKNRRIGIVGPMSNYVSGPQLVDSVDYDTSTLAGLDAFSQKHTKQHEDRIQPYWRVVGFCMLIKRQVIDRIGGLDDRYGLGNFEDDDFTLRAALAGFGSAIAKDCFIHHFGHRTFTGAKIDMEMSLNTNWNIFKEKWGLPPDLPYGAPFDFSEIVKNGFDLSKHYTPVTKKTDRTIDIESASRPLLSKKLDSPAKNSETPTTSPRNTDNEALTIQGGNKLKSFDKMYQEVRPLIENGWYEAAISALEKIAEAYPEKAIAYQELGALYYKLGQAENALFSYRQAMQLQPENIEAQKNLADFYYAELGQDEEALKIYENILVVAPHDVQTLLLTGHIHVSLNRFDAAKDKYRRVLEIEPWNADARQYLEALEKQGAGEAAAQTADALYAEIGPSLNSGSPDAAIQALEKLSNAYPDFALAHNDLGVLYYQQGDKTAAQLHYEHAVRFEPDNMTFQKNLADFYFVELNRVKEAMSMYVKILEANPEDVETLMTAGHISTALQRFDDARTIYNRILEIEPWNADARQSLEKVDNQERGRNPAGSIANVNQSLEAGPRAHLTRG